MGAFGDEVAPPTRVRASGAGLLKKSREGRRFPASSEEVGAMHPLACHQSATRDVRVDGVGFLASTGLAESGWMRGFSWTGELDPSGMCLGGGAGHWHPQAMLRTQAPPWPRVPLEPRPDARPPKPEFVLAETMRAGPERSLPGAGDRVILDGLPA